MNTVLASMATRTEIDLFCCPCCGAAPVIEASVINKDGDIHLSHDVSCNPCGLSAPLKAWTAIGWRVYGRETARPVKRERTPVGYYRCPACNAAFIEGEEETQHCGNCGQKLLW